MKKINMMFYFTLLAVTLLLGSTIQVQAEEISWGIPRKSPSEVQPFPGAAFDEIIRHNDAFYMGDEDDDGVYLTFDCGYENGNLPAILDALKEESIQALFFVTGHFMETEPELLKRMVDDGHLVGNHTYDHPNMTTISYDRFQSEIKRAEEAFYDITGKAMDKYLRPPEGRFNQQVLDWAKQSGYYTILWSLAYVDWYVDQQKGPGHACDQVMNRLHPGAIILLHSTSSDNAVDMPAIIDEVKEAGYIFKSIQDLVAQKITDPLIAPKF